MKELKTEILIKAQPESVWKVLMDFDKYPEWNPFVISISGKAKLRERLSVYLKNPDSKPMKFTPQVVQYRRNETFSWLGRLWMTGLFDGHHIFELHKTPEGYTQFIQREEFNGILVSLLWKTINTKSRRGFELMNEVLKERVEKGVN